MPVYRENLEQLRRAFPQPISDQEHDAWFVFSMLRAFDQVDALKSAKPILGDAQPVDFAAAVNATVPEESGTVEAVSRDLVEHLSGMFIWGHPRSQVNVIPPPCIAGILGTVLPAIYNPNLCGEESSRRVALAEAEAISMTAAMMGYDPAGCSGVFTFGGTGTLLYAIRIGIEKCCPGTMQTGLCEKPVVVCSDQAHYATKTAATWLGIGLNQIEVIPTAPNNEIRTCLFESELRRLLKEGKKIAAIVATMGTTDAFGIDHLEKLVEIRDHMVHEFSLDYVPHIHADAVIGWAWSVFNGYDFGTNPLGFPHRTVRALAGTHRRMRHLGLSDSLGIDYHKTGFAPYISSAFLCRDAADLQLIARSPSSTPYLFQSGEYHPGRYTLETTRSGSGPMSALANLLLFGRDGLRSLLGHLVGMAETLREHLEGSASTTVLNGGNFGSVTLFRVYPDGVDTFNMPRREMEDFSAREQLLAHNDYNRRIFQLIQHRALHGEGVVLSLTDCYRYSKHGDPVVALKSYIMSPFSEEKYVDFVLQSIWKARQRLQETGG
ncbi:MAG: aspartate aminotransferase family protein [Planctomycetaceae bacterium]|nr:aspartate aminotransferase family protein [Planctomycetaceae bacterium]